MKKLLIATLNKGKLLEITKTLADLPFEIVSPIDVGVGTDFVVEEPAMTFEGNAIIKAIAFGQKTGLLALADDSGLDVDALGGRPGVYSARYAPGTDEDRYRRLLDEMKDISDDRRGAQFRCVIAIYDPDTRQIRTCEGVAPGRILHAPQGTNGFGYDPVFWYAEARMAGGELTTEEKNRVSHRGKALRRARDLLHNDFR